VDKITSSAGNGGFSAVTKLVKKNIERPDLRKKQHFINSSESTMNTG